MIQMIFQSPLLGLPRTEKSVAETAMTDGFLLLIGSEVGVDSSMRLTEGQDDMPLEAPVPIPAQIGSLPIPTPSADYSLLPNFTQQSLVFQSGIENNENAKLTAQDETTLAEHSLRFNLNELVELHPEMTVLSEKPRSIESQIPDEPKLTAAPMDTMQIESVGAKLSVLAPTTGPMRKPTAPDPKAPGLAEQLLPPTLPQALPTTAPLSNEITVLSEAPTEQRPTQADSVWHARQKVELSNDEPQNRLDDLSLPDSSGSQRRSPPQPTVETEAAPKAPLPTVLSDEAGSLRRWESHKLQVVESASLSIHQIIVEPLHPIQIHVAAKPPPEFVSQVVSHLRAATSGGVEILLNPEELGKVRFEIHHTNDTVRIILTAERAETMEMLRRNSDQLLQEFRQSGFTGTSLSFGQWGQQEKSARSIPNQNQTMGAQAEHSKPLDPVSAPPTYVEGQGLNIRL